MKYRDEKGRYRNPRTYEGKVYAHIEGEKVLIKREGEQTIAPQAKSMINKRNRNTDEWINKSEKNEEYRQKQTGKMEFKLTDRLPASMTDNPYTFISSDRTYGKWQDKMKTYEVLTDSLGNKVASRTIDEYNQRIYQQSKHSKAEGQIIFDKKEQAKVVDLFEDANKHMENWEEDFGITVGKGFHLYKSDDLESITKKINKAIEVTSDNYLEKLALSYKLDFISNFSNHVQGDDFSNFLNAVSKMENISFLKLIKDKRIDFLAYALDSIINRHGIEQILSDVRYLTARINDKNRRDV